MGSKDTLEESSFKFDDGRVVKTVRAREESKPEDLIRGLGLPLGKRLVVIAGEVAASEASEEQRQGLIKLLSRGVAQAAARLNREGSNDVTILDASGQGLLAEIVGEAVEDRESKQAPIHLVGVLTDSADGVQGGQSSLDSRHPLYVLTNDLPKEARLPLACGLAAALAGKSPAMVILVGGELAGAAGELVLFGVRRGWPVAVVKDSGGLAEVTTRLMGERKHAAERKKAGRWKAAFNYLNEGPQKAVEIEDPQLAEILEEGKLSLLDLKAEAAVLRRQVAKLLGIRAPDSSVGLAWQVFAQLDANAKRHQKDSGWMKTWPLALTVMSTFFVLLQAWIASQSWLNHFGDFSEKGLARGFLHLIIVLIPITIAVLLALDTRFKAGSKWILLRAGAEAVKREIYSHRALDGLYKDFAQSVEEFAQRAQKQLDEDKKQLEKAQGPDAPGSEEEKRQQEEAAKKLQEQRNQVETAVNDLRKYLQQQETFDTTQLAQRVGDISASLMKTEVSESALEPYEDQIPPEMFGAADDDDGFTRLTPEQYLKVRLGDQLTYFSKSTVKQEKLLRRMQVSLILFGAVGTFLVAVGGEFWLPLSAAIVAAVTAYLEFRQTEQTLMKYNQTSDNLKSLFAWWVSLPDELKSLEELRKPAASSDVKILEAKRAIYERITHLIKHTEEILETEQTGWVREMRSALERQRDRMKEMAPNLPTVDAPGTTTNGGAPNEANPADTDQKK